MLASPVIDRTIVTDPVAPFPLMDESIRSSVDVVATGPLFAETISRLNAGGSIADLLGD